MTNLKKALITVLVCLNCGLMATLVHVNMKPARAQSNPYRTTDYVVVTSKVSKTSEALVIIDLASRKIASWKWNVGRRRLDPIGGRTLPRDFKVRSK